MSDTLNLLRIARARYSQRQVARLSAFPNEPLRDGKRTGRRPPWPLLRSESFFAWTARTTPALHSRSSIFSPESVASGRPSSEPEDDACSRANGTDGLSRRTRRTSRG